MVGGCRRVSGSRCSSLVIAVDVDKGRRCLGAGGVTFGSFHELPLPNSGRSIRSVLTKWDDSAADGGVVRNSLAWIYSNSNE